MKVHACSKSACAFRGVHTRGTCVSRLSCSWCVPYLDIYYKSNCLTYKCSKNTIREVYCKFSDKSTSTEMCNCILHVFRFLLF